MCVEAKQVCVSYHKMSLLPDFTPQGDNDMLAKLDRPPGNPQVRKSTRNCNSTCRFSSKRMAIIPGMISLR